MTTNCHFSNQIKKQNKTKTKKQCPLFFYENSDGGNRSFGNQRLMIIADN